MDRLPLPAPDDAPPTAGGPESFGASEHASAEAETMAAIRARGPGCETMFEAYRAAKTREGAAFFPPRTEYFTPRWSSIAPRPATAPGVDSMEERSRPVACERCRSEHPRISRRATVTRADQLARRGPGESRAAACVCPTPVRCWGSRSASWRRTLSVDCCTGVRRSHRSSLKLSVKVCRTPSSKSVVSKDPRLSVTAHPRAVTASRKENGAVVGLGFRQSSKRWSSSDTREALREFHSMWQLSRVADV